jgi:uncharacterized repeat protein (TIGR03803 family)
MKQRRLLNSINTSHALSIVAILFTAMTFCAARPATAQTGKIIYRFQNQYKGGLDPSSGFVADETGNLYGVTAHGGEIKGASYGAVYRLAPPSAGGGTWRDEVLYSFRGTVDGENPYGNVLLDSKAGKIFGTAASSLASGIVYQLTPGSPWSETVIYSFTGASGENPNGGLISDTNGALYGTTTWGGAFTCNGGNTGCGVVFRLTPPSEAGGAWTEQVLYNFQGGSDGWLPSGGLVFDKSGALYGVTFFGGPENGGTIYKLTPPAGGSGSWTESILHSFSGESGDGAYPQGSLIVDRTGALYGTANDYGQYGFGNVFQLVPPSGGSGDWTENILYQFSGGRDGATPDTGLAMDSVGNLYGPTTYGGDVDSGDACSLGDGEGNYGCGTIFKLVAPSKSGGAWTESVRYTFRSVEGFPDTPVLLLGNHVYGTTPQYGSDTTPAPGTAFQVAE